jgi:hypothetical protein
MAEKQGDVLIASAGMDVVTARQLNEITKLTPKKSDEYVVNAQEDKKRGGYVVYDGMKTFLMKGLDEDGLDYLKRNGQLKEDFDGEVYALYKGKVVRVKDEITGRIESANLAEGGVETINWYLNYDYVQRAKDNADLRKKLLEKLQAVPIKEEEGKGVKSPVDALKEKLGGYNMEEYVRKGKNLPPNPKNFGILSEEFDKLYDTEIDTMKWAIECYKQRDDPDEVQKYISALITSMGGKVTPTKEIADLMLRFMYESEKAGIEGFSFVGTTALIQERGKWKEKELTDEAPLKEMEEAFKTKEGKTWLTGILQNWEKDRVEEYATKEKGGYSTVAKQAEVLDWVLKTYGPYGKQGEYGRKQQYLFAGRLTENTDKDIEIVNPVDYQDVSRRTAGNGWKALGPSTMASLMFIWEAKKEPEPVPTPKNVFEDLEISGERKEVPAGSAISLKAIASAGDKQITQEYLDTAKPEFTYLIKEHVAAQSKGHIFGISLGVVPATDYIVLPEKAVLKSGKYDATDLTSRVAYLKDIGEDEYEIHVCIDNKKNRLVDPTDIARGKKADSDVTEVVVGKAHMTHSGEIEVKITPYSAGDLYPLFYGKVDKEDWKLKQGKIELTIDGKGGAVDKATYDVDVMGSIRRPEKPSS